MTTQRRPLLRRLGALRRCYTGETDSSLWPTITAGIKPLSTEERAAIIASIESGFETRLLGENLLPPLDDRIRQAVLADATDLAQQQLEAAILFALGRIGPYLWPKTDVVAPMPVCTMVRPVVADAQMVLHLRASASAPMIATLLPRVVDGTLHGLAGLRARVCRRHVVLYLADRGEAVSVSLAGTTFRQWAGILGHARAVTGHEWPLTFDEPLTAPECAVIAAGRVPDPVPVASALLRRLRILGGTVWLTVHPDGPTGIRVDWSGGRTAAQVATALVHPLTGLPGERFLVTPTADGTITIMAMNGADAVAARIVLHRAPLHTPPPFARIDATAAWAEFDRAMTEAAPTLRKPAALAG